MSNAQSGASYDAILIDRITAPAQQIIQTLGRLDAAFRQVATSSAPLAQNMQVVAAAMRQASRGPNEQAIGLGMVFNRVSEMSSQLGSAAGRAIEGIGRVMQGVGVAALGMSAAITMGLLDVIKVAGDATETLNAFNIVIDSNTNRGKEAITWAEDFADTLGRSSLQTKKAMTTYQSLWKGLGAGSAEATKLTKTMVQLQTDFGSFFNVSDDESLRRFIAALSGSSEVLDQFGINIRENALEAKAQTLGFGDNVRKMTEYQKALTRAAILNDVLSERIGALGDAARTQFEWANQVRSAEATLLDLKVALGNIIIPELKPYLQSLVILMKDLGERVKEVDSTRVKEFLNGLLTVAGVGASLLAVGTAVAAIGVAVSVAAIGIAGVMTSIGAMVAGGPIAAAIVGIMAIIAAAGAMVAWDAAANFPLMEVFENIKKRVKEAIDSVNEGMQVIRKAIAAKDYATAWDAFKLSAEIVFYEMAITFKDIMFEAIRSIAERMSKMFTVQGRVELAIGAVGALAGQAFGESMEDRLKGLRGQLSDLNEAIPEPEVKVNDKGIADAFKNITGLTEVIDASQAWKKITDAGNALKAGFEAASKEADRLKLAANDWADSMLSPTEKFVKELQKIRVMESMNVAGRVTPEMVKRAQMEAAEKLMNELPKPPKFQATSVGTFSRNIAANASDFAPAFDAALEESRRQTKELQLIRQGVQALDKGELTF